MSKPEVLVTLRPERVQLQSAAGQLPEWELAADGGSIARAVRCASVDHLVRFLALLGGFEGSRSEGSDLSVGVFLTFAPPSQPALVDLARALDRVSADFIA